MYINKTFRLGIVHFDICAKKKKKFSKNYLQMKCNVL